MRKHELLIHFKRIIYLFGQVRALFDDGGKRVDEAGPSIPVQVRCLLFFFLFICIQD